MVGKEWADEPEASTVSADGRWLAGARRPDGTISVWDLATGAEVAKRSGYGTPVECLAFRPDGRIIAVGTIGGYVRFFDPSSGAAAGRPVNEGNLPVWQVAFSPDGKLLAVAVDRNGVKGFNRQRRQGEVQLWDVRSRTGGSAS